MPTYGLAPTATHTSDHGLTPLPLQRRSAGHYLDSTELRVVSEHQTALAADPFAVARRWSPD